MELLTENGCLTISQLNGAIRDVISMGFPSGVWICGEVQGYNRNKDKRHIFFELCEKDLQSKDIVARIGLVIFEGRKIHIEETLRHAENAFQLKDDIEVKLFCRVDFYPPHGAVRLIVESIDPVYTLGKIAQEKQRLIALLRANGVLDKNKKLDLSPVPLNVGLITAFDSAAYHDFIHELTSSRFGFKVFVRNTLMQGKGAEKSVCEAIDELNARPDLDVLVITRGGGSIAELSCFDSERIAQRIASSPLPVLSGIGHEINITVTDLAAHTCQKTPTAVAQFLVTRVGEFLTDVEGKGEAIIQYVQQRLAEEREQVKGRAVALHGHTQRFLKIHSQKLAASMEIIARQPLKLLKVLREKIVGQNEVLEKTFDVRIKNERLRIRTMEKFIELAGPVNTLRRGFSITKTKAGRLVRTVRDVQERDELVTQVMDGILESAVVQVVSKG